MFGLVFCFCSQKVVFTLFSNFGFKYSFLPFSIQIFLFGDCFSLVVGNVFIYYFIIIIFTGSE